MTDEIFKAENGDEVVWLRLNRLKSVKLCENLLRGKLEKSPMPMITDDVIKSKAIGLSSAVESAIGYWRVSPESLNAKILSRYYFLLQMTIAEQVSSIKNTDDLKTVQRHTENGHGLGTIIDPNADFPNNYFTRSGHFYSYAKTVGIDTKKFDLEKRPRNFEDIHDKSKIVNLLDLFRRIPELSSIIEEYIDLPPLCFNIGHPELNILDDLDDMKEQIRETKQLNFKPREKSSICSTYIAFYSNSKKITPEYLESLGFPMEDFALRANVDSDAKYITAKLIHPSNQRWFTCIETYRSSYSPTSIIAPLWNATNDNIVINLTLLYTLSIIVRYLPDHWYRINTGDLNHIGSLVEYYISIIDHILPLQMLPRSRKK
jgi:hypothetical protein